VKKETGDTKDGKEVVERQFEVNERSDEERQNSEESKQDAQENELREFRQTRSIAEQEKTKKRCADNNLAKVSSEDSEEQTGQRGTLRYERKESLDQTTPQSEGNGENTKQKDSEVESSKGTPCYSSFLTVLGSCLRYTYTSRFIGQRKLLNRTMG
jgi:hypothetical protein